MDVPELNAFTGQSKDYAVSFTLALVVTLSLMAYVQPIIFNSLAKPGIYNCQFYYPYGYPGQFGTVNCVPQTPYFLGGALGNTISILLLYLGVGFLSLIAFIIVFQILYSLYVGVAHALGFYKKR